VCCGPVKTSRKVFHRNHRVTCSPQDDVRQAVGTERGPRNGGNGRTLVTEMKKRERTEKKTESLTARIMTHGNELCYDQRGETAMKLGQGLWRTENGTCRRIGNPLPSLRGPRHHDVKVDAVLKVGCVLGRGEREALDTPGTRMRRIISRK
jgi:hypothetical protein